MIGGEQLTKSVVKREATKIVNKVFILRIGVVLVDSRHILFEYKHQRVLLVYDTLLLVK